MYLLYDRMYRVPCYAACCRGGLSYTDLSNQTLYEVGATNSTYGYHPWDCTGLYNYICEVPQSRWLCPPSPPASAPLSLSPACESQDGKRHVADCEVGSTHMPASLQSHNMLHPAATGLPLVDESTFCNATRGSCYKWGAGLTKPDATNWCAARGGYIVALNTYEEQVRK